ncbi:hypothetical protein KIN20_008013 [Parelaphostrongylus tenuis]|uniref:Uncharacterized protein n=1 Tax=Parelaphostrongylus tenuis TaxID=148309 RepID=A0AAD5QH72_PARTN|nr:hypothetical protein KIN20_008013 [Parelaphostrongylus tenuis]
MMPTNASTVFPGKKKSLSKSNQHNNHPPYKEIAEQGALFQRCTNEEELEQLPRRTFTSMMNDYGQSTRIIGFEEEEDVEKLDIELYSLSLWY